MFLERFYHLWLPLWCFVSLGVLNTWTTQETVSSWPGIQMAKCSHPPALPQETLHSERSFHFLWACDSGLYHWSKSWASFVHLEGGTVETSAPQTLSSDPAFQGVVSLVTSWWRAQSSVNFRPNSNEFGIPCWKANWILVCPRLCPWNLWADDWYVSLLRQGYTVEKSSKSIRSPWSSGPHKKAIANWEKARLHSSQLYWLIRQSHPLHLCL